MTTLESPTQASSPGPPLSSPFAERFASLLEICLRSSLHSSISSQIRAKLLQDVTWADFDSQFRHHRGLFDFLLTNPSNEAPSTLEESVHPVYKYLAYALCEWTTIPPGRFELLHWFSDDETWKIKAEQWRPRVTELLSTLKELLRSVKFQLHVQEPFFSQLKDGSKTVEGRCAVGAYNSFSPGDLILFNNVLLQEVKAINRYSSFKELLITEGLDVVLPGVKSLSEGVMIYRRFYPEEKERIGGVLAIHVHRLPEDRQPLKIVGAILDGAILDVSIPL